MRRLSLLQEIPTRANPVGEPMDPLDPAVHHSTSAGGVLLTPAVDGEKDDVVAERVTAVPAPPPASPTDTTTTGS